MAGADGAIIDCQITSTGTLRGGDDISVEFTVENRDSDSISFDAWLTVGGYELDRWTFLDYAPGSQATEDYAESYNFQVWRALDWSGVGPNEAGEFPATLHVAFWKGSNSGAVEKTADCGTVTLYNEAQDSYEYSASTPNMTGVRFDESKTFSWRIQNNTDTDQQFTVWVRPVRSRLTPPQKTVTVPAGSSRSPSMSISPSDLGVESGQRWRTETKISMSSGTDNVVLSNRFIIETVEVSGATATIDTMDVNPGPHPPGKRVQVAQVIVTNSGGVSGTVNMAFARLDADGAVIEEICRASKSLESNGQSLGGLDNTDGCRAVVNTGTLEATMPNESNATVYYGFKTWADNESEPQYPTPTSDVNRQSGNFAVSTAVPEETSKKLMDGALIAGAGVAGGLAHTFINNG